jgi:hypothetical protein
MLNQGKPVTHQSTPYYNLPYPLARRLAQSIVAGAPRGTFYKLMKNGQKPNTQLKLQLNG